MLILTHTLSTLVGKSDSIMTLHVCCYDTHRFFQENGTWACKHGPSECAGDLQQLCVQQEAATGADRLDWLLPFVLCTNAAGMDAQGQLTTAARCLKARLLLPLLRPHELATRTACTAACTTTCAAACTAACAEL